MHKHHEQNTWNEDILLDTDISLIDNKFDVDFSTIDGSFDLELGGVAVIEKDYPLDVDRRSIDINLNSELELMNYGKASQGQIPAYDSSDGIVWIDPVSDLDLRNAVTEAENYANRSIVASNQSSNYSIESEKSANKSKAYADSILNKFWFGTATEYNKLMYIDPDVIYVIIT